jgi:hypothetical protein
MNHLRSLPRSLAQGVLATLLCLATGLASAGNTYVYVEKDGTTWYTNQHPNTSRRGDFTLVGIIGRPTASVSCKGTRRTTARAKRYENSIRRYARRYGVSPHLVKAIISVESCFDDQAISRAGARGLMQLMPTTAKLLGVDDALDYDDNIRGGVEYYAQLLQRFERSDKLALAAYNAGPGAVEKHGGVPPYRETQKYVRRVLDQYREYVLAEAGS